MKLVRRRAQGWMQHGAYVQGEGKYQSPTESLTSRVAIVTKQVQNLSSNCIRFGPKTFAVTLLSCHAVRCCHNAVVTVRTVRKQGVY